MNMFRRMTFTVAAVATIVTMTNVRDAAASDHGLLDSVPGNAVVVARTTATDKNDTVEGYYQEFFQAVLDTGVIEDVVGMFRSNMSPDEYEAANAVFIQVRNLVSAIDWKSLTSDEMVFAMRWEDMDQAMMRKEIERTNPDGSTHTVNVQVFRGWPSQIYLFRQTPEQLDQNYNGFSSIFQTIAGLDQSLTYNEQTWDDNGTLGTLDIGGVMQFGVAKGHGVLGLGLGTEMLTESYMMMATPGSGNAITNNPRFTEMLDMVAAPDSEMSWADINGIMNSMKDLIDGALNMAEGEVPSDADEIRQVRGFVNRLMQEVSFVDRTIMTVSWDSQFRMVTDAVCLVSADAENSFLFRAMAGQGTFEDFHRYVPENATSFAFNSGANFAAIYDGIKSVLVDSFPEAEEGFGEFEGELERNLGINVRDDVLGWISGESIAVHLPSFGTQANSASMLRVTDDEKALDAVSGALGFVDDLLRGQKQAGLTMNPAAGRLGEMGFISIFHPFLGMAQLMPVLGVHDGYLAFGSSAKALDAVYATASGDAPSILDNAEFGETGLVPDGPATSITYTNLTNSITAFRQQAMMMVPMLSMVAANAGPQADVLNQIIMLSNKLLPTLNELDFFRASSSVTTFDGSKWHTKSVLTYKEKVRM